jgi:peptidoglycan/LPS O-acetylase OafA/YrhL
MLYEMRYRRDIQVLRGLAVISVVLFHINKKYFTLGYLGVDVFFVISGFVVTPLILRIIGEQPSQKQNIYTLKDFYIRRFYRLAPALASTIIISGFVIILLDPFNNQQNFARQAISALLLIGNFAAYKYSGDYFTSDPNPLVHTWSLSVEEQIYLFLPLMLLIILRKRKKIWKNTIYIFLTITILSLISFLNPIFLNPVYSRFGIQIASQFSFYSPLDRVWQFTIGGLVFFVAYKFNFRHTKFLKLINLGLVSILTIMLLSQFLINQKVASILASILTLLIILLKSLETLPEFLSSIFEWLGNRSYSIYLIHMPVIHIIDRLFKRFITLGEIELIQSLISFVVLIPLGALSYSKIENRFRSKGIKKKRMIKTHTSSILLTLIMPLTLLLPFGLNTGNNLYKDRLDDGVCKFWTPVIDSNFYSRFRSCNLEFGKATIVLGDSHALNIYNSLFLANQRVFLVGISKGGCRPNNPSKFCQYSDFEKFIKLAPESISKVLFHQSGSYLISDLSNNLDSDLAFRTSTSFRIRNQDLNFLVSYLNNTASIVPTTWIGPFPEARINSTLPEVWADAVKPNPIVKIAFTELENQIHSTLSASQPKFDYISLIENLGPQQYQIQISDCLMFRDKDHWSLCAEEIYSKKFKEIMY